MDLFICCQDMNELVSEGLIFTGKDENGAAIAKAKFEGIRYGERVYYCPKCGKLIKVIERRILD